MTEKSIPFDELRAAVLQRTGRLPMYCAPNGMRTIATREIWQWLLLYGVDNYGSTWWAEWPKGVRT